MHDSTRLARLIHIDSKNKSHKLHSLFTAENGKFCTNGTLMPINARKVYMMAGIISPSDDNIEEWFQSIKKNIVFLNNYLEYSQPFVKPIVEPKIEPKVIETTKRLELAPRINGGLQVSTDDSKKKPRRNRKTNKSAKDL